MEQFEQGRRGVAPLRVGLFSIGLEAYWPQFAGLRERLLGYNQRVAAAIQGGQPGAQVEVVNLGMVDSPEKGYEAGSRLRQADVDMVFIHSATYALSSTVLPAVRRAGVPIVILNLSPEARIDYAAFNRLGDRTAMTGEWLAYCGACPVPEMANVFSRAGIAFHQVTGTLDPGDAAMVEIREWTEAARVARAIEHNRLGLMGHYYGGMLDIATDLTVISAVFGSYLEQIEVDELTSLRHAVTEEEVRDEVAEFERVFDIQPDCDPGELGRAARTAKALKKLVERHQLDSLAYYAMGAGNPENEDTMSSIILGNSLLTAHHVPVAGEYEVKNAVAMKILDTLGAGGSFTEYYALDFTADTVLMGHDGPGHVAIAEGKAKVRPLKVYHGKVGKGLSIEMSVKRGPVTLLSVAEDADHGYKLVIAEGESVAGQILEIGNTNSHYRFSLGARGFVEHWNRQGPAHHCAVGIGHVASKLKKFAALLRLPAVQVC